MPSDGQTRRDQLAGARTEWVVWLLGFGVGTFYDAFMEAAQDAESRCINCGHLIYLDIREGGGVPDWCTVDGDYGCNDSPETTDEGVGSHAPRRKP